MIKGAWLSVAILALGCGYEIDPHEAEVDDAPQPVDGVEDEDSRLDPTVYSTGWLRGVIDKRIDVDDPQAVVELSGWARQSSVMIFTDEPDGTLVSTVILTFGGSIDHATWQPGVTMEFDREAWGAYARDRSVFPDRLFPVVGAVACQGPFDAVTEYDEEAESVTVRVGAGDGSAERLFEADVLVIHPATGEERLVTVGFTADPLPQGI